MEKQIVIIAGAGKTTRANIEALMDDHYYAVKNQAVLHFPNEELSEAQTWAKQHAESCGIEVIDSVPAGRDVVAFLLWSDEDPVCQDMLFLADEQGFDAYDLTHGLCKIDINPGVTKVTEPEIPALEMVNPEPLVEVSDEEDTSEPEEEEDVEEGDPLYEALYLVADIFAEAIVRRLSEMNK